MYFLLSKISNAISAILWTEWKWEVMTPVSCFNHGNIALRLQLYNFYFFISLFSKSLFAASSSTLSFHFHICVEANYNSCSIHTKKYGMYYITANKTRKVNFCEELHYHHKILSFQIKITRMHACLANWLMKIEA